MTDLTPEEALPCEDPEEPCDQDGRDEHRWCDYCIARSVLARQRLTIVPSDELARLRAIEEAAQNYVSTDDDDSPYTAGGSFRDLRSVLEGVSR